MISVDEALSALDENRPDWGEKALPLSELNGHRLAIDIIAPFSHPKVSVSVMDGYAFAAQDGDKTLTIIGESRAGEPFDGTVNTGQAVRIFTGAVLPNGTDTVEMQENAILNGDKVSFATHSTHRNFVRKAGADFVKGTTLFTQGEIITPAMILAFATCNFETIMIKRQPIVALLSSGDELKPVGSLLEAGQIVNSITPALTALLTQWGADVIDLGIAADQPEDIADKLKSCKADIIVPIGGASVGDYDYMQSVAKTLNFAPVFSKVAIKPGKPTWFSKRGEQRILGLPGNPSSAWVCAQVFLKHLILGQQTLESEILDKSLPANGSRETYLRGKRLKNGKIKPLSRQDSGLVTPLSHANILIRRTINSKELRAGLNAEFIRL